MRRRQVLVLAVMVLPAAVLVIWGIAAVRDASPNPVRVIVGEDPDETLPQVAVPAGATANSVEVVVARARPIPMKVAEEPVTVDPSGVTIAAHSVDIDVLAAEEQQLRTALDAWLAAPGRALRIETAWTSLHRVQPGRLDALLRRPAQALRVVLHARLRPSGAR